MTSALDGVGPGEMWGRLVLGGRRAVATAGAIPVGGYFSPHPPSSTSAPGAGNGTGALFAHHMPIACAVDRVAFQVSTLGTGAAHRIGFYEELDSGLPGALICDLGTLTLTASGEMLAVSLTPPIIFPAGRFLTAMVRQSGTAGTLVGCSQATPQRVATGADAFNNRVLAAVPLGALPTDLTPYVSGGNGGFSSGPWMEFRRSA